MEEKSGRIIHNFCAQEIENSVCFIFESLNCVDFRAQSEKGPDKTKPQKPAQKVQTQKESGISVCLTQVSTQDIPNIRISYLPIGDQVSNFVKVSNLNAKSSFANFKVSNLKIQQTQEFIFHEQRPSILPDHKIYYSESVRLYLN